SHSHLRNAPAGLRNAQRPEAIPAKLCNAQTMLRNAPGSTDCAENAIFELKVLI
ncbi:hypothetical protein A2U01_0090185, partial [Trifolium medium]|nr:hypothetical protein [Trifolium medium]